MPDTLKDRQLGMKHGTASNRLVKDILWSFIVESSKNFCHHCGEPMCRKSFSIEHITPWIRSGNPLEVFFDLGNITYSHKVCNLRAARKPHKYTTEEERLQARRRSNRQSKAKKYDKDKRHQRYLKTGQ